MSRAFTKEPDGSEPIELTERQISLDRNLVTETGLGLINNEIEKLKSQIEKTTDELVIAQLSRDMRYWAARLASAELIKPSENPDKVTFGTYVTIKNAKEKHIFAIVGQDEANPLLNLLSYTSPIARQLIGKELGDEVDIGSAKGEIIDIRANA